MRTRTLTVGPALVLAALVAAGPLRADSVAEQIRKVREAVAPSTVIVAFYVERDDGAKADVRVLGTVVGPRNLILFSSAAIAAQFATSQFHDFKVMVPKGDDLQTYTADYLGKDDQSQVAFLRMTDPGAPALPVLEFDESTQLEVGDPILTFASLGEPDRYERTIQMSRVAAKIDQPATTYLTVEAMGSPASPIVTLDGKAVGIVGYMRINRGTNARPNWVAAEIVWPTARFIGRLKNPPKGGAVVRRPWLGVQTLTPVTKDLAEYFKLGERRGVVIGQVVEGGPAEKAGLKQEDIILAVNGQNITGTEGQLVENFTNDLRERKAGETLRLDVWRAGQVQQIKVALAEQPKTPAEAERYRVARLGMTVREMVVGDRMVRELPASEKGVVVAFIDAAGWAQEGGLQVNDIIKKVQDRDVTSLGEFRKVMDAEAAKKPKEVVLFVLRGKKETQLVRIETRWDAAEKPKAETPSAKPDSGTTPPAPAPNAGK